MNSNTHKCAHCGSDGVEPHIGDCPIRLKEEITRLKVSALKCMARINELTKEIEKLNALRGHDSNG